MFDNIHSGILAKYETKAKKSNTVQLLNLKFEAIGEDQSFLDDLDEQEPAILDSKHIPGLFRLPIGWKGLTFELGHVVKVTLHDPTDPTKEILSFRSVLHGLKVARVWKNGNDVFTYTVVLEKELDPNVDKDLVHFVNAKARNPRTDKMEPILWPWTFEAIEPAAASIPPEGQDGTDAGE